MQPWGPFCRNFWPLEFPLSCRLLDTTSVGLLADVPTHSNCGSSCSGRAQVPRLEKEKVHCILAERMNWMGRQGAHTCSSQPILKIEKQRGGLRDWQFLCRTPPPICERKQKQHFKISANGILYTIFWNLQLHRRMFIKKLLKVNFTFLDLINTGFQKVSVCIGMSADSIGSLKRWHQTWNYLIVSTILC